MSDTPTSTPPRSPWRMIVQLIGFVIGLALLAWVVATVLTPDNRARLGRLADASPAQIIGLCALSVATLGFNGLLFWLVMRPARRLPLVDTMSVNAIATVLAYLPFKLSVLARVAIHRARHGVSVLRFGAWMAAMAALIVTVLGPVAGVSLLLRRVDATWAALSIGGAIVTTAALVAMASVFAGTRGMGRIHTLADPLGVRPLDRFLRSGAFAQLHEAFAMLAHPWTAGWVVVLRLSDIGVQAARFSIAAAVLGVSLPWESALLVAAVYFIIGVLAPSGSLGSREGGALLAAKWFELGGADGSTEDAANALAAVIVLVSVSEAVVNLAAAGLGATQLRVDRMLRGRGAQPEPSGDLPSADADRAGSDQPDDR